MSSGGGARLQAPPRCRPGEAGLDCRLRPDAGLGRRGLECRLHPDTGLRRLDLECRLRPGGRSVNQALDDESRAWSGSAGLVLSAGEDKSEL